MGFKHFLGDLLPSKEEKNLPEDERPTYNPIKVGPLPLSRAPVTSSRARADPLPPFRLPTDFQVSTWDLPCVEWDICADLTTLCFSGM